MAAELRLVLLGMTGSGKSSSGNTILGQKKFQSDCSATSVTRCCQLESAELTWDDEAEDSNSQGATMSSVRKVSVIDVPGFGDTTFTEDEVRTEIAKSVSLSAPGPHAFVLVVPVGRYTDHQNQAISAMTEIFGEEAVRHHTLVLFTRGDDLEDKSIETFLRKAPAHLTDLVSRCRGRFHVFNNKDRSSEQVKKLLEKLDHMVDMSPTGFYTKDMFDAAETAIREEEQRMKRLVEEEKDEGATRARKRASAVKRQSSSDDSVGGVSQKMKREQLQRGDGGRSNDEEDRVKISQNYHRVPRQEQTQFRSEAALSPAVLDKIKILFSAVDIGAPAIMSGAGVGAALGVGAGTATAVGETGPGYTASHCSTGTVPKTPPAGPAGAQVLNAAHAPPKSCIKSLPGSLSLKVHVKKAKTTEENSAVNTTYELTWNTNKESA